MRRWPRLMVQLGFITALVALLTGLIMLIVPLLADALCLLLCESPA